MLLYITYVLTAVASMIVYVLKGYGDRRPECYAALGVEREVHRLLGTWALEGELPTQALDCEFLQVTRPG